MNKQREEDFYPARSELIGSLLAFIKLCDENGRDIKEEINEALWEAQKEYQLKDDDILQID